jgi:hypothetical protein
MSLSRVSIALVWGIVACTAALAFVWGPLGGLCMANDDLKFVRSPARGLPLAAAMADAWNVQPSFRPLEVLVAHLSDPVTLECPWVPVVQGAGLLALLLAVMALVRQSMHGIALAAPAALLLVLLSPATTASVWQMDSCSQTWTAALGAWSAWLSWRWISRAQDGRMEPWVMASLCGAVALGLMVKENFYGWSAGLTMASACALAVSLFRAPAVAARGAWVLVPVALVPILHFACRWRWSALAGLFGDGGESRYEAEFGANLLVNTVVSLAGAVGSGPFHLIVDGDAPVLLRALPVVATATVVLVILLGLGAAAVDRGASGVVRWGALAFASSASILSLCATIPMASVSELYGCGANVGCALLAVGSGAALWKLGAAGGLPILRTLVTASIALVAAVGCYGIASRAYHFSVVWRSARALNDAIVAFQPTLAPNRPGDSSAAGMVHVPTACLVGVTHSQYVMPALQVIDLNLTEEWLVRRDPTRPIVFSIGTAPRDPRPIEMVLNCDALPQHGHW